MPAFNGPLVGWKRTTLFANYTWTTLRNNTNGPFSLPATGSLDQEWGPAAQDIRHRLTACGTPAEVRGLWSEMVQVFADGRLSDEDSKALQDEMNARAKELKGEVNA